MGCQQLAKLEYFRGVPVISTPSSVKTPDRGHARVCCSSSLLPTKGIVSMMPEASAKAASATISEHVVLGSLVRAGICIRLNSRIFNPSEIVDQTQTLEFRDERVSCLQLRLQLVDERRSLVGIHALEIDKVSLKQSGLSIEGVVCLFEPLL